MNNLWNHKHSRYPKDVTARLVDKQFLWGPALLISPVLQEGKISVNVYFPQDVWYNYYTVSGIN